MESDHSGVISLDRSIDRSIHRYVCVCVCVSLLGVTSKQARTISSHSECFSPKADNIAVGFGLKICWFKPRDCFHKGGFPS